MEPYNHIIFISSNKVTINPAHLPSHSNWFVTLCGFSF